MLKTFPAMPTRHLKLMTASLLAFALVTLSFTRVQAQVVVGATPAKKPAITAETVEAATRIILEEVGELRQLKVLKPVKSGIKSRAEIERMVRRNFDEETKPEKFAAAGKAMIAFGLAPQDFKYRDFSIRLLTEQVAGFYDPKTKEFFLADWNELETQKPVIAHELTHALQDQHFDLRRFEKWPDGDGDREMAIHALIEGDASALMYDFMLKPMGQSVAKLPMSIVSLSETGMAMAGGDEMKQLKSAPAAIRDALIFPYIYGAGFVQELLRKKGWEGVSQAFTELPQSTEQILHFDKYLTGEKPVKVELADLTAQPGKGWKLLLTDINGEFGYSSLLSEYLPKAEAKTAAAGWGGDQYALYERAADGKLLIVHRSEWDTKQDAEEFFRAYSARTQKRYATAKEREGLPVTQHSYATPDGETFIELRDQSVVVIEGLPADQLRDLAKISGALWKKDQLKKP